MSRVSLCCCVLLMLLAGTPAVAEQLSLARIDQPVDIKIAPDPKSTAIARAEPGDRYQILAMEEGWYQIQLFQDSYFLPKSTATELMETMRVPDEAKRKAVFRDLYKAEDEAVAEAEKAALIEEKTVVDDAVKNHYIERAKLLVARKHGLSVPACIAIAFEGADQGWPAR